MTITPPTGATPTKLDARDLQMYYALGVLAFVEHRLIHWTMSTPQLVDPESQDPAVFDARTANEIGEISQLVGDAIRSLVGPDELRGRLAEGARCLPYDYSKSFDEVVEEIASRAARPSWDQFFWHRMVADLRSLSCSSSYVDPREGKTQRS